MSPFAIVVATLTAISAAVALVVDAATGLGLLAAGLGLLLILERRNFGKLRAWAAARRLADPPEAEGEWGDVFNALHRHRRGFLRQRRRLALLMVRTRHAAQALPYGVAMLDPEFRIEWANTAGQGHLGIDPEIDRGQPVANFVRQPEFAAYLAAGRFDEPLELRLTAAEPRILSLQLVSFEEDSWLLLSRDVTGAERLEAMRRDFVANVSHELRTPLTVLSGFLETILDLDLPRERVRDYAGLMAPQAARMRQIIDDLLTLSALEHSARPREERIAIRTLLERVRDEALALSGGRHRITLEVGDQRDLSGAETEVSSILLNLATNAVRYTPEGGEVRLAWRVDADGARFVVEDTGIGVPAEHIPRLTERFYRVDRSRSRDTGGTGLGLSIVKHALARHQGTLEIQSTPGKGSRFSARFPLERLVSARATAS